MAAFVMLLSAPIHGSYANNVDTCIVDPFDANAILPTTLLTSLGCAPIISLTATRGEYESASFAIRSEDDIHDVEFSPTDLLGSAGRIPSANVSLKYVKVWYQAAGATNPVKRDGSKRILVPELLLNDDDLVRVDVTRSRNLLRMLDGNYVDISVEEEATEIVEHRVDQLSVRDSDALMPASLYADQTRQMWLTVLVPANAAPGEYRGTVTISSRGEKVATELPIHLRVPAFRLAPPVLDYSIYYRAQLDPSDRGSVSSELKSKEQFVAELRNMVSHGIRSPTVYQKQGGVAAFRRVLELRAEQGLSNTRLFQLGIDTSYFVSTSKSASDSSRFLELKTMAASLGVKEFYVYGVDEASPAEINAQRGVWGRVRDAGGRLFAAAYKYGPAEREYAGNIDVLVLGIPFDPKVISFYQSAGTRVYVYNQPQVGVEDPVVYRSHYGLLAWQAGFDGVMNYAYQHSMGSIWNDFDNRRFKDHVFAYPTINGVIDTVAWEGFREGVDDIRYISTLIAIASNDEGGPASSLVQKVRASSSTAGSVRGLVEEMLSATCLASVGTPRNREVCIQ